jgi:hypothetical protein
MKKRSTIVYLTAVLSVASAFTGRGATLMVDDNRVQCPTAQYTSIQAAVIAAKPGDTISVCPGTYAEQVAINKNITIQGNDIANQDLALIKPAAVLPNSTGLVNGMPVAAAVLVDGASNVNLSNLTVDASNNSISDCGTLLVGIYYRNSSGKVNSVAVRNVVLGTGHEGCNSGYAIFAQSGNGGSSNLQVTNSSIHDYQKNGIIGQEAKTQLTAQSNALSGVGANPNLAQNGIQFAFGAKGTADSNLVINHIYAGCNDPQTCNFAASNILVFQAGTVKITNNNTGKSQLNIALATNNAEANNNVAFDSDIFYGVYAVGSGNKVQNNSIFNSASAAVFVDGASNNIQGNTINEAPVGIQQTAASTGTNTGGNKFFNVGVDNQTLAPSPMAAARASSDFVFVALETPIRP